MYPDGDQDPEQDPLGTSREIGAKQNGEGMLGRHKIFGAKSLSGWRSLCVGSSRETKGKWGNFDAKLGPLGKMEGDRTHFCCTLVRWLVCPTARYALFRLPCLPGVHWPHLPACSAPQSPESQPRQPASAPSVTENATLKALHDPCTLLNAHFAGFKCRAHRSTRSHKAEGKAE